MRDPDPDERELSTRLIASRSILAYWVAAAVLTYVAACSGEKTATMEVLVGGARLQVPLNTVVSKVGDADSVELGEEYLVVSDVDDRLMKYALSSSTTKRTRINGHQALIWEARTFRPPHGHDYEYIFVVAFPDADVAISIEFIGDRMLPHARECMQSIRPM